MPEIKGARGPWYISISSSHTIWLGGGRRRVGGAVLGAGGGGGGWATQLAALATTMPYSFKILTSRKQH